jgi:hypothetical protein
MEAIFVPMNCNDAFLKVMEVISDEFPKKNDWKFLKIYFFHNGKWEGNKNFTHLGITKDGNTFPTTFQSKPDCLEVPYNQLDDKIALLKDKGHSLTSDEVIKMIKDCTGADKAANAKALDENGVATKLRNAIRYNRTPNDANIIIPVIDAILASGEALLYTGPITQLVSWDWKEAIRAKFTPVSSYKTELIGGHKDKQYDKIGPLTYEEIVGLVSEFATSTDAYVPTQIQIRLGNAIEHRYNNDHELLEVILGCMLIDGGRRRDNVLQYIPVMNLLMNGEMGQMLVPAEGELIQLD